MAGRKKVHVKTQLNHDKAHHTSNSGQTSPRPAEVTPPSQTVVHFGFSADTTRTYDFARHYGVGTDEITLACQRQVERFLNKQDSELEVSTVASYATAGLASFLPYLSLLSSAHERALTLADIDRDVIDGYLSHLQDMGLKKSVQGSVYNGTKQILRALGRRGLVTIVDAGDNRTFPKNPHPNSHRHVKGETPLTRKERLAFTAAVKTAVMPLFHENVEVSGELLAYALLVIALHTGRNTTPLLEMRPDCLRSHPKDDLQFLVLWKRRGHNFNKVTLREDAKAKPAVESMPAIRLPVVRLVRRLIELSSELRDEAPAHLTNRVWLYRSKSIRNLGIVTALNDSSILDATQKLVADAKLVDADGRPLRINVSRLRKTFANRIFELLDGDIGSTAIALGNTPQVAGRNYMAPTEDSKKNWRFMGELMTKELLSRTLGSSERTPTGHCTDPIAGQYAPKSIDSTACFSFLNCVRCKNYVVTGDDLYRLFSFYWRVLLERNNMDAMVWEKHYAHIPRLIDRDVIEEGLAKKIFRSADVDEARRRARDDPHPFWKFDSLSSLDDFRDEVEITQ